MERQVETTHIVQAGLDALRNSIHHVMPGNVVTFDEGQDTIDVQPGTNDPRTDLDTGAVDPEPPKVLRGVPVAWPRFGGMVIKGTLNAYDPVMLIAVDLDPTSWRKAGRTLKPVDPADIRRHGGAYWFALPVDITLERKASAPGKLTIGAEGAAPVIVITGANIQLGNVGADFVALASKVDACMALIKTHVHAFTGAVSGASCSGTTVAATTLSGITPTGSTLVKAQ